MSTLNSATGTAMAIRPTNTPARAMAGVMISSNAVTPLMDVYTLQSCHTLAVPPRAEPKKLLTAAEKPRDFSPKCVGFNQTRGGLATMGKTGAAAYKRFRHISQKSVRSPCGPAESATPLVRQSLGHSLQPLQ